MGNCDENGAGLEGTYERGVMNGTKTDTGRTQNSVLLKSRRRCCLCFWLEGIDEVRKGQIAHLDQNNENADEDNLVFLCLDHHDEYDAKTSTTKGFKLQEVRRWRDELYREMEYRFRTVKKRDFELTIIGFTFVGPEDQVKVKFRLKNTGEVEARTPVVSIRLPQQCDGPSTAAAPTERCVEPSGGCRLGHERRTAGFI